MPRLPRVLGRFRVVGLIARGGMGVVYEAEQEDPKRRVALKILRPDLISPSLLRRFQLESRILGLLKHPGIAQVYEAGTTDDDGQELPYFAMELVEGRSILEWANERELDTDARLRLFALVCDAVEHAHMRGVIHRDLKPDNILVTNDGHPKVLDFGVARLTDADIQATTVVTRAGQIMGTLAYMSPEQLCGDPDEIDLRSDVYALGVVLFELLSGCKPYDLARRTLPEVSRIIRDEDATLLGSLDTRFRGDLETIVGKALEKDVGRRYASSAALAEDIRLYLAHLPIGARPPSSLYQLRKFAVRHQGLVGGAALVFVALLIGLGFALRSARLEASQRSAAEATGYRAALSAASLALDSGRRIGVRELLDQVPEHQRGWEWEHFRSRTSRYRWRVDAFDSEGGRSKASLAFSLDDQRVIAKLDDRTLGVWDTQTGAALQTIDVGGAIVPGGLAAGPQGVAVLLQDGHLVICDDRAGVVVHSDSLPGRPSGVSWDPNSGLLAVSCRTGGVPDRDDCALLVGTPGKLEPIAADAFPYETVGRVLWALGGRVLLVETIAASRWSLLRGFDTRSWSELGDPVITGEVSAIAASTDPGAGLVALATSQREVLLFGVENGRFEPRATLRGHVELYVSGVSVSRDGSLVASAAVDGSLRLWDGHSGDSLDVIELEGVPDVRVSPSGRFVAVHSGGRLSLWSREDDAVQVLEGPGSFVYSVAWSPDGRTLVARDFLDRLRVYDALEGQPITPVVGFPGERVFRHIAWGLAVDGARAIAVTDQGGILGMDLVSGNVAAVLAPAPSARSGEGLARRAFLREIGRGPPGTGDPPLRNVLSARRSVSRPDYEVDPSGGVCADPWELRLQDAVTGAAIRALEAPGAEPLQRLWDGRPHVDASFSPDGSHVAIVRPGSDCLVFDCSSGALVAELRGHRSVLYTVAWNPDGTRIATGSNDRTIRIWDAVTYEPLAVLRGHDSYVKDLAWSPDGRTLASGSGDGTVRLWGTRTVASRTKGILMERDERERQRPWVARLLEAVDDPHEVETQVRARIDLTRDQRHAALRVVRELANAWWESREAARAEGEQ